MSIFMVYKVKCLHRIKGRIAHDKSICTRRNKRDIFLTIFIPSSKYFTRGVRNTAF